MNARNTLERPDYRKYRLLREALVDVRPLVPEEIGPDGKPLAAGGDAAPVGRPDRRAGLRLDAAANALVLCAIVAIVLAGAADPGLAFATQVVA
jgi:hypothetical protein